VVYFDLNRNGTIDAGEARLSGWRIFIDRVGEDGVLVIGVASVTTDAAGKFSISTLAPGTYRLRIAAHAGYRVTSPGTGYRWVTVAAGGVMSANFGEARI
jgi:hypothetical protein